ncbi:MAG: helical backbone metal receptor [Anaerolineae bacterium]|nr:helical backbone metal receptor [Anaerolineae bacterium]MDW8099252.1 helical backbone metal receptor [Anaerolineae bacterium]
MKVYCDPLGAFVQLPEKPQRIVSLVAGFTETLVYMGYSHLIAGISAFCPRFTSQVKAPIVGDYLKVDRERLRAVEPDLVLVTTGVQRNLAKKLHQEGFPVYALPLPNSLYGILENVLILGALVDDLPAARDLVHRWEQLFFQLKASAPEPKPRVYAELWFGKHVRMAGGLTFINDLIVAAGGENVFGDVRAGYLSLDLREVERRRPDIFLCFSEPEYPVQATDLQRARNWNFQILQADVTPSHNIIHDGPSMMEAVQWLRQSLQMIRQLS